jgi:CelD/BcsL family acetyltransferase involved in cellulose biosynthesis
MEQLGIQVLDPFDEDWLHFLQWHTEANIFHHPAWLTLLKECYGFRPFVLTLRDQSGSICAGLPVMETERPMRRRRWISLPFSDHCIPLVSRPEDLAALVGHVRSLVEMRHAPRIQIRWHVCNTAVESPSSAYVLHLLEMGSELEKVESRIHHSHRRNVRIAQDHGIEIRHGTELADVEEFYKLHLETRRRQGAPIQPAAYFRLLREHLFENRLGFVSLAYHGSQCLAGAIFLHWNRTLTYKYGASTESGLVFRPNHLMFWEAIQWGCKHGYSLLDFGRSDFDNEGLRLFKSRWGAQEIPLHYIDIPAELNFLDRKHFLSHMVHSLIRISPPWVCRLGGEIYYRIVA